MERSNPEPDNSSNGTSHGAEEPTYADVSSGEDHRWMRSVVENSSEIVTVVDPDGTLRYASPAFGRMLGHDPEEAVGTMNVLDLVHPEDLPHVLEETEEALSKGGVVTNKAEYRFRHRDGSWRWMESVGTYLLDDPHVGGVVVTSRDVTERKKAEEKVRFQARLLDAVGEAVIAIDMDARGLYWNRAAEEMYGWSSEEVMGRHIREIIVPNSHRGRAEDIGAQVREGKTWTGQFVVRRRDGTTFPVEATNTPVFNEDGDFVGAIGVFRDITDRTEAEEALRESERRFGSAFRDAAIGMALVGTDGRFLQVNRSLCNILGYSEEELLEKTFQEITHPDDLRVDVEQVRRMLAGEIETYQKEKRYFHKEGHVVWGLVSVSLVHDEGGEPLYFISQLQDITERKRAEERLHHQAHHDLLTDLPNRQLFLDRLGQALGRTRRRPGRKVAVLFVDLDNFKIVNDSLGHEVGDLLLVRVGERLRRCLRPEDTLSRFGGDEFTMLLENLSGPRDTVRIAERIIEELRSPFVLEGRELVLRASIGIALGNGHTKGPGELLKDADTAMYRAKEEVSGYRIFESGMYEQALRRLKVENDMRRAVEAGEFTVHYQPIVDLRTGEVWGSEALVRWEHPERGLLEPSQFVPVAEETGLIVPLGERVLEKSCRWAAKWQRERPRAEPLIMCVNLSARQLRRQDLTGTIKGVLRRTGLEGRRLCLDITETLYITVLEGNTAALDELRRMGVRISIDDFGMGYSSLSYLKRLPVDTLKVDRSFVSGLGEDAEDTAIVRMIIELAHTLGMRIIGEGVESEEQAEQLIEMGCDLGQGFHFAEPLPPEALSEFLRERPGTLDL